MHSLHLPLLLFLSVVLVACASPDDPAASGSEDGPRLTLRVTEVPATTPDSATVYVAGSFNGWAPGDPEYALRKEGDAYEITLDGLRRGPVEFKFMLGRWDRVEVDAAGEDVRNRTARVPDRGTATYEASVARWKSDDASPTRSTATASVSVLDVDFEIPQLDRTRRVWLYLPPDYEATDRRYPVLYLHDGQNVFDASTAYSGEWGVDETLDSLHAEGDPGVIVVAVDNGGERRLDEYSPWTHPEYGGGEGEAYVRFLVETLKPYVDRTYRTRPGRASTGIGGSSMGGLISLYALLEHPDVFGKAIVFSPALWFARDEAFRQAAQAQAPREGTRITMVTGETEGEGGELGGRYAEDARRMADTLAASGYERGTHLRAIIHEDGAHREWFWRREFGAAYRWAFDAWITQNQ